MTENGIYDCTSNSVLLWFFIWQMGSPVMEEQLQLPKPVAYFRPTINVIYINQNENAFF